MSYSYIKSVFPNFETSKVYGENQPIYNGLNEVNQPKYNGLNDINQPKTDEPKSYMTNDYISPFNNPNNITNANSKEGMENVGDNLKFYNLPYVPNHNQEETNIKNTHLQGNIIETFESTDNDHEKYILHVLDCTRCKNVLMKQLGIMEDKIRMENYMELASYIIFGIFILLLIDIINKK